MGLWRSRSDHKLYYQNGKLERHEIYENGNRVEGKYWYENGQLQEHTFYNGDKREGTSKSWYKNGNIRIHTFYHEGKLDGKYMLWHDNGRPNLMAKCHLDKNEGESKYYNWNGRLIHSRYYMDGNGWNFTIDRRMFLGLKQRLGLRIRSDNLDTFLISDLKERKPIHA